MQPTKVLLDQKILQLTENRRKMNIQKILKILSIYFILVFILSMIHLNQVSYANITETQNKGNINVSNVEGGVDVYLYQIATIEYDYLSSQPKEGYHWESSIQEWIDSNFPNYSKSENFYQEVQSNSEEAKNFYDELTAAIKGEDISISAYATKKATGTAVYPVTESNLTGTAQFSEVDMGTYLVLIENGYMVYTPSVVNLVPSFDDNTNQWILENQSVIIKATNPSITKTVTNEEKQVDNYSTNHNITYTIKADVPTYLENSLAKKYSISDKLDPSLTIQEDSLTIYGLKEGKEAESIYGYDITFDTTRPESQEEVTFLIDFDYSTISSYDTIKIVYTAKLNEDSVIGTEGNNNYAYLTYSNNPYEAASMQTQKTGKVTVYTYGIEIQSVDKENQDTPLAGSEFTLYDEEENQLYFIQKEEGVYYLANSEEEGATTSVAVDEQGNLYVYGLDEGKYTIQQTKAPEGYNVSSKTYEIELIDNEPDGVLDKEYTLIFPNTKGFLLPVTGGKGVIAFVSVGIALIAVGIALVLSIIKKKKILEEKNN